MRIFWLNYDSPEWNEALLRIPHDVFHRPAYVHFEAARGGGRARAFLAEEGDRRFFLPLVIRPIPSAGGLVDATAPYGYPGPLLAGDEAFLGRALAALKADFREQQGVSLFMRFHPLLPIPTGPFADQCTLVRHGLTVGIDLTLPPATWWRQTRATYRNEINRARRAGLTVDADPSWSAFEAFLEIYLETMRRSGAAPHYFFDRAYFLGLREALAEALHLLVVRDAGQIVSAALFTEAQGIVQYFLAGTRRASLSLHPSKLLLDRARVWAGARQNRILHLGGGRGGSDDSLFYFKAGFSPRRFTFYTARMVSNQEAYEALCRGIPHADGSADFFPAYRRTIS